MTVLECFLRNVEQELPLMRTRYAALLALAAVICQAQIITTIAGTPPNTLPNLAQIARDSQGNLYFLSLIHIYPTAPGYRRGERR